MLIGIVEPEANTNNGQTKAEISIKPTSPLKFLNEKGCFCKILLSMGSS